MPIPPPSAPIARPPVSHRVSVAPMMDWTDRHCRAFHRVLTRRALLYTEMAVDKSLLHGDPARLIGFAGEEHPVALQLGGSEPDELAAATRIAASFGYDEINLNVGCPSDRVQSGRFGACLMLEPALVAECAAAMLDASAGPVTVKCRIGVDDQDPQTALFGLVDAVAAVGITTVIVHARKAWLSGLSPKENRTVPPLDYALVRRLKAERPQLEIILNGGLDSLEHGRGELDGLDGFMLGRAAYHTPWTLARIDSSLFGQLDPVGSRGEALDRFRPYIAAQLDAGTPLHAITRHLLGLYQGLPGARAWRRVLSEQACRPGAGLGVLDEARAAVDTVRAAA